MKTEETGHAEATAAEGANAHQARDTAIGCAVLSVLLLAILGGVSTCAGKFLHQPKPNVAAVEPRKAEADAPKLDLISAIKKVPQVRRVEHHDIFLEVYLYQEPTATTKYYVDAVAYVAWKVGNLISSDPAGVPSGVKEVVFVLEADLQDRLGNPSTGPTLSVTIPLADLKAARYENLSNQAVLDLSSSVGMVNTAGREMALAWCSEGENMSDGSHVCAKFLTAD